MKLGIVQHSFGVSMPVEKAMERAHRLGCQVFMPSRRMIVGERERYKELFDAYGMEAVIGWGDRLIEQGAAQPTDELARTLTEIHSYFGVRVIPICSTHHRWRKDPPLAEQLERLSAAFRVLCPVAEDFGMVFAIENHADYRAGDLLRLLDSVDRPSLRIQLDTGNAFAVAEEPVDAARSLAPHVVSTHIKDMTIRPLTDPARHGEWCKVLGSGIGEGDVDIPAIARLLQEYAPDPDTLPFCLEIEPPPGSDHVRLCEKGVEYVRRELAGIVKSAS